MVKFDQKIINIMYDYLPFIYDKTIDISILELDIDYRQKANNVMNNINKVKEKAFKYSSQKISNYHLSNEISKLYDTYYLYLTWGAIQTYYNNNINYFGNNIIDLHGLYQKEVTSVLYIYFNYIRSKNDNNKVKIITGRGTGAVMNITVATIKTLNLNFKIENNCLIVS